jgi:glycosyltransferase involved in cell wall biosynthesis
MKAVCIGNYPPRKCGIATFTENLVQSVLKAAKIHHRKLVMEVVAMNDAGRDYDYPEIVTKTISEKVRKDYDLVADYINSSGFDICLFQHEYGIYGGESGLLILSLLKKIKIPVISTFHTVLLQPTFHQKVVLAKISRYSNLIVVMNSIAIGFLEKVFEVPKEKIIQIEHGVPDYDNFDKDRLTRPDGWNGRQVMLTFGLIGRSKGIETVIKALPAIAEKHPEILYVVLGKTHPSIVRYAGEEYREYLMQLTKELGVENHVNFLNEYVSEEELMNYLLNTSIYVTPYLNKAQITSGTLAYAVGAGAAVVSTPYWHAEEILANDKGRLFDFKDHHSLANIVNHLLDNPDELNHLRMNAALHGRSISWPKIGLEYLNVFEKLTEDFADSKAVVSMDQYSFPDIDFSHLIRLTDDTGLIQHARGAIADYKSGYCLDDNTRALIVCTKEYQRSQNKACMSLIHRYLAFMTYMQNSDGSFNNYLSYWRNATNSDVSDDAFGRAVWALGYLIRFAPGDTYFQIAHEMFAKAQNHFNGLTYSRGFANSIRGLYHFLKRFPDQDFYSGQLTMLADKLCDKFLKNFQNGHPWFESILTYDNGLLPGALFMAFEISEKSKYLEIALQSMEYLEAESFSGGHLSIIGNKNWDKPLAEKFEYAQQPVDALAMLLMYHDANRALKELRYLEKINICMEWFLGNNDLLLPLYDTETCGCNDGLEEFSANRNQGAESIIAYLLSRLIVEEYNS